MRSIRQYLLWIELVFAGIIVSAVYVATMRVNLRVHNTIYAEQRHQLEEIERYFQSNIHYSLEMFQAYLRVNQPTVSLPFLLSFDEVYDLDSEFRVTALHKKARKSILFQGYDFSSSELRSFLDSLPIGILHLSPLMRSPESDGISTYITFRENSRYRIGRIGMEQLNTFLSNIALARNLIIAIASPSGYLLSSTRKELSFHVISPFHTKTIIDQKEYLVLSSPLDLLGNNLVVLSPYSKISDITSLWNRTLMILAITILLFFLFKLFAVDRLVSRPLRALLHTMDSWGTEPQTPLPATPILNTWETRTILEQFSQKNTQIHKYIQELSTMNKELEQMVYVASHDLRSPLVNIDGFTAELEIAFHDLRQTVEEASSVKRDIVQAFQNARTEIEQDLRQIHHSAKLMDSLLRGLQRLSRSSRQSLKIKEIDMQILVQRIAEEKRGGHPVEFMIASLPPCRSDETQLEQIFSLLMENAIKFRRKERTCLIQITGYTNENSCTYCMEDNGIGIAPEYQHKIFELFHRLEPTKYPGEGLGLTMVRQVLARLGGEIRLESIPGTGSKFFITLPQ